MRHLALLFLIVPGIIHANDSSTAVQTILNKTKAQIEAYGKAQQAWLTSGKPFKNFPGSLAKEVKALQGQLAKAKDQNVRQALTVAISTLQQVDFKQAAKANRNPDLQGIPALSPVWSLNPTLAMLAAHNMKDPAAAKAYIDEAQDHHPDPNVRKQLLFWSVIGGTREGKEAEYTSAMAKLEAQFPDDRVTKEARKEIQSLSLVKVGAPAPAFSIASLDDPKVTLTLESFRGKYLLIDFWATWCGPCVAMLPTVHKLYAEYKPKGLEILSIADDKSAEVVQAFRKKPGKAMPWNHAVCLFDEKARKRLNPITDDYGIHGYPTLVLIGPDGKVLAKGEELHSHLGDVLAQFIAPQVDLDPLKKEMDQAMAIVQAAADEHRKAGKPMNEFKVDQDKAFAAIRSRGKGATGTLRHACLVAELGLVIRMGQDSDIDGLVFQEVPAESPAWELAADVVFALERTCGEPGKVYMAKLKAQGIPVVKLQFRIMDADALFRDGKVDEAKIQLDQMQKEFPNNATVKMVSHMVAGELKTTLGQPSPDFQVANLEDSSKAWTLADFKGKYLLIDFWGTWCGYCVKELPETHKAYEMFKGRGLEILSLASDKAPELVVEFRKKPGMPMPWKHGYLGGDREHPHAAQESFGVTGFPSLFLIGPDGKLLAKGEALRGESLVETLAKFLPAAL